MEAKQNAQTELEQERIEKEGQDAAEEARQKEAERNALRAVTRVENLIVNHLIDDPMPTRDDRAVWILVRYMVNGDKKIEQITQEEAREWLDRNGHQPNDFSVQYGTTIRKWHPA